LRVIYDDTGQRPSVFIDGDRGQIHLIGLLEIAAVANALRTADRLACDFTPAPAP
jgi:hypothetical protein